MSPVGTLDVLGEAAVQWPAIGTTARVVVAPPRPRQQESAHQQTLASARWIAELELAALDAACSRFRPDSEVRRLEQATDGRPQPVSPLLFDAIAVALDAARATSGDLDPTIGTALVGLGYDRDFAALATASPDRPLRVVRRLPGWQRVRLDAAAGTVQLPPGTLLDLGATAKAWAADRIAARITRELSCGVLVSLGGDISCAGPPPAGGWTVAVQDRPDAADATATTVTLPAGGALATSSTGSRAWRSGPSMLHHIVDPRTLRPAAATWRYVTVSASTCLDANIASTTALIRGRDAVGWLDRLGLPARLVAADSSVVTTGGWPPERTQR